MTSLALTAAMAQRPQRFHKQLPPGNYSGIAPLGGGRYALVSDKTPTDGFYVVRISIDSIRRRISSLHNEGFRSSGQPNRDIEAVCYCPSAGTVFIAGEKDGEVPEYSLDGQPTGRRLMMPQAFGRYGRNVGIESLTYDTCRHLFITTTERPLKGDSLLRIQTFGDNLKPRQQYLYRPDAPISRKYFHGVSELCALSDGRLLVLERQIRVPRLKIGATTVVRIYEVSLDSQPLSHSGSAETPLLGKRLVGEVRTRLNLFSRRFANYEGLCELSPGLLLLVADSQNRYKGILRDWLLVLPTS